MTFKDLASRSRDRVIVMIDVCWAAQRVLNHTCAYCGEAALIDQDEATDIIFQLIEFFEWQDEETIWIQIIQLFLLNFQQRFDLKSNIELVKLWRYDEDQLFCQQFSFFDFFSQ